ncbi:TPA: hypothetical protein H1005_04325 [archaeon]|uniref:Uncharacterized protein n=1 Tax=Candidatus Naiadarchaeum limnaeum TaxID=2756139 RepID=A0A832VAG2_9ARCH|nr:hypothetical protein [Candidatus Naiadarchaeales archaeon SRR2090153.bin1042]HIK00541.1 hypothetical protein [Candidatus Naiadarchaeum limnaeum]
MEKYCSEKIRGCERNPEFSFKLNSNITEDKTTKVHETYYFCLKHVFLESIRHTYWSNEQQNFISNFSVHNRGLSGIFSRRKIFDYFAQEILKLVFKNHKDNPKVFGVKTLDSGDIIKIFGPEINLEKKYTIDDSYMSGFFLALGGLDDLQTMFISAEMKEKNEQECRDYIKSMLENHTRIKQWLPVPSVSELHQLR